MDLEYLKDTIKEIKMPDDMKKRIVDTALDSTQDTTTMKKICNLRRFRLRQYRTEKSARYRQV